MATVSEQFDSVMQSFNAFIESDMMSADEYEQARAKIEDNKTTLAFFAKREQGLKAAAKRMREHISRIQAENAELNYRIREVERSPYSPLKSHFRTTRTH